MMSDLVCEQFYRNQVRFAGPLVDYTELQRGMHSFSYSSSFYNSYDRMSIDVIYNSFGKKNQMSLAVD